MSELGTRFVSTRRRSAPCAAPGAGALPVVVLRDDAGISAAAGRDSARPMRATASESVSTATRDEPRWRTSWRKP